jgi:hypothetical protein
MKNSETVLAKIKVSLDTTINQVAGSIPGSGLRKLSGETVRIGLLVLATLQAGGPHNTPAANLSRPRAGP